MLVTKGTRKEREEKLRKIIYASFDEEMTCAGLVERANKELNGRARLCNTKQLGSCLKVVMSRLDDVVLEKKVMFLSPNSSSVSYVFREVTPEFKQELNKKKIGALNQKNNGDAIR